MSNLNSALIIEQRDLSVRVRCLRRLCRERNGSEGSAEVPKRSGRRPRRMRCRKVTKRKNKISFQWNLTIKKSQNWNMTPLIQQQQEYREKLSECGPVITEAHYNSDRTCLYETNYEVTLEGGRGRFIVGAVRDRRGNFLGLLLWPV